MTTTTAQLRERLPGLMLRDQRRLERRIDGVARTRDPAAREAAITRLGADLAAAQELADRRRAAVPAISYPPELPVSQRRDELAEAIRANQVVIIAGETGSGKTTQLPKICLELGRGITGQIGHTQPRRIAARTVAERIAAELGTEPGTAVGYKVRFSDTSSESSLVKVMTDGILLTEMQRDRLLLRYDTLIIDEAHERSLNIDFILGYLKQLLPRRPDLKVIITSATIDPERFARHFAGPAGPAPVIEVSGRTYPVEVRYRPLADPGDPGEPGEPGAEARERDALPGAQRAERDAQRGGRRAEPKDQVQGICEAVDELCAEGPGDILVFLSGEREIRDAADALAEHEGLEVLPLYARLSAAEQYKVFQAHRGRRVVLATNVAETSLTVPGIKYVIDPGTARISRYSQRTKVQRLPIEPISQASANQRKGRCGRTSDGVCIRLYSEADFDSRPQFTDPEILRTNLAAVILRMAALDLGAVADFPFVDPPESRNVADGVRLLEELGALSSADRGTAAGAVRLTGIGRKLSELPVDPRLGRMILQAGENGCAHEVLVITSALSIQDPRERPADSRDAADAMHRRFAEPGSDFLAFLTLWDYLRDQQRQLSASAFRRMCRREYLHYLRIREWQDVYGQLLQAARDVGITVRPRNAKAGRESAAPADQDGRYPADLADRVHQSVLAGLLSHIGMQDTDRGQAQPRRRRGPAEFAGARGARFAIFPDSPLARKPPRWVMAAELIETSRLWARTVARIEPEWVEPLAAHLVRRSYSEPRWDARRGAVMATEKVSLYGLPVVAARPVNYGRIDPETSRDLFIQHALVEGDWQTHHRFFARNQRAREEAAELERKARRRGLVADDAAVFRFYDERIPKTVVSARHFDSWWKRARADEPGLLDLGAADLAGPAADDIQAGDYPDSWAGMPLSYEFAPGEPGDGVTADISLDELFAANGPELGWQVPGLRLELVTELIRGLPKDLRRLFVPVPDTARAVLASLGEPHGDLLDALATELRRIGGEPIPRSAWDVSRLPGYLQVSYRVLDGGEVLATGKDLDELRRQLRPRLDLVLGEAAAGLIRTGVRRWDFGTIPRVFSISPGDDPRSPRSASPGGDPRSPRSASPGGDPLGPSASPGGDPRSGQIRGYPALADAGDSVDLRVFGSPAEADEAMRLGTRRLLLLSVPSGVRSIAGRLPMAEKMALSSHPYPGAAALLDDCAACAADQVIADAGGPAWDADGFAYLVEAARDRLAPNTAEVVENVARILAQAHEVEIALTSSAQPVPALAPALADLRAQLGGLIYPGFVSAAGLTRLPDLLRYLRAMVRRLDKLAGEQARDAERMAVVHRVTAAYESVLAGLAPANRSRPDVVAVRWLIEELRVSLFAQVLGTAGPVSEKRIMTVLDGLTG